MTTILLIGSWDFSNKEVQESYQIAEAAMRSMYPKAFVFNLCQYMRNNTRIVPYRRIKVNTAVFYGAFSHVLLLNDWWLSDFARRLIDNLGEGFLYSKGKKPIVQTITEEMEQQGKEYLSKLQKVEHQSKRREADL